MFGKFDGYEEIRRKRRCKDHRALDLFLFLGVWRDMMRSEKDTMIEEVGRYFHIQKKKEKAKARRLDQENREVEKGRKAKKQYQCLMQYHINLCSFFALFICDPLL